MDWILRSSLSTPLATNLSGEWKEPMYHEATRPFFQKEPRPATLGGIFDGDGEEKMSLVNAGGGAQGTQKVQRPAP